MLLRDKIASSLKVAMKERDATRLCTLRLITAAINDLEIAKRGCEEGAQTPVSDEEVRTILAKMIRQRADSTRAYEEAGRLELAEQEQAEVEIIEGFMPRQLSDDEKAQAIQTAITDSGAESIRDMGKVMGLLKQRHAGRMDFSTVSPAVRDRLVS
ncbi:GatB/YqeY domain-containing protein [Meridianimarinicoccus aquatilis]|uniref:GatB/YqeY domain-containing protein n=1 Tax=Meridianimarinicoccus aquatilis TaxID=2552766 RepID=A0A4R6B214_9RHOB|nr:GatB/YqeY domain-containing protein [Fluviibacterium aquatile]QIE42400.1 GatB/YqeY domain-containing protein [Rhodobacteraceae bacterium SC52]TDL91201.1 GatB/YqeY domain-containing protein [Fluviibacterium aquatile]